MAIINSNKNTGNENKEIQTVEVPFICPICKTRKELTLNKSIINDEKLTTVSIPSGICCAHSFQAFIDKQFKVRGYQKVDFEFSKDGSHHSINKNFKTADKILLENLILEGNHVEYRPSLETKSKKRNDDKKLPSKKEDFKKKNKRMSLKEIYDEFWEFIDETNEEFSQFIQIDSRRKS